MDIHGLEHVQKCMELLGTMPSAILWGMHGYIMNPPVVSIFEDAESLAMTRPQSNAAILQSNGDVWPSAELGCYKKKQTNHAETCESRI